MLSDSASDESLMEEVRRARDGSEAERAFRILVERYRNRLFSMLRAYVGSKADAEDVSQDVLFEIYRSRARYRPGATFRTWLWAIARQRAIDHLRRMRAHPTVSLDKIGIPLPERDIEPGSDKFRTLEEALRRLTDDEREILLLRFMEGLSSAEVGSILGCSPGNVRVKLHRAIRKLRQMLFHP